MGFILRQVDGRELLPFEICLQDKGVTVRTEVLKDQYLDMLGRYDHITFTVAKVKPPKKFSVCNLQMRVEPVFREDGTRFLRANVYKRWWLGHIPLRDRSYVVRSVADLKKKIERVIEGVENPVLFPEDADLLDPNSPKTQKMRKIVHAD